MASKPSIDVLLGPRYHCCLFRAADPALARARAMRYVCVGDRVLASTTAQDATSLVRGHGVLERPLQAHSATRCGSVQRWNQLVLVDAFTGAYTPAVGHVVVGRVVQVGSGHPLASTDVPAHTHCS